MLSANPTSEDICRARLFEEPLVSIGADPAPAENAALAAAVLGYSERSGPDDFSSLTGFLEAHPSCPWNAALLLGGMLLGANYEALYHAIRPFEIVIYIVVLIGIAVVIALWLRGRGRRSEAPDGG